jgi:hypothetical protein
MYSSPILEKEIARAAPVYGETVCFEIADLVRRGVATVREIDSWSVSKSNCAWLEGASNPVVRNLYRGQLPLLVKRNGRYFTHLFVNRAALIAKNG